MSSPYALRPRKEVVQALERTGVLLSALMQGMVAASVKAAAAAEIFQEAMHVLEELDKTIDAANAEIETNGFFEESVEEEKNEQG